MIEHVVTWKMKGWSRTAQRGAAIPGARAVRGRRAPHSAAMNVAGAPVTGRGAVERDA